MFVPWRIVSYNILSGSSRGPDIFGTEPWHFYIRNLLLNFNAWFLLGMCAGPLLGLQLLFTRLSSTRWTTLRSMMISTPFYMWLTIFSAQSHKEERFMYPAYPFLCLNAAIALHTVLNYLGHLSPKSVIGKCSAKVKLALVSGFVLAIATVGILRTLGTVSAYSAPLEIYKPLQSPEYADMQGNVCLGKEWYRFPSSYFLPKNMRPKFVKSAFDGLLPGEFSEGGTVSGILPTWLIPPGMNNQNIEDPGKHVCLPSRFNFASPANFCRSMLVIARSWWIRPSLDPSIRCWSRIISSMGRTGSKYCAISFSTPRKPIHWVASSGYLTGNSFQRSFEENGAGIVCYGESRPLLESLARSLNYVAQYYLSLITIWAKRSPSEEQSSLTVDN